MANNWYRRLIEESNKRIGLRVRVKHSDKYKRYDIKGRFGTVIHWYGNDNIAVRLEGIINHGSQYGYFYFAKTELEIIENRNMEETTMAINNNTITNYLNIAKVLKTDGRVYDHANYIPDLKEGDLCVVVSVNRDMTAAKVVEIIHENDVPQASEIVCKLDITAYETRVETRKKAAELKAKMQERAKKLQDIALFQTLAKDDEEMAALLSEFTSLNAL